MLGMALIAIALGGCNPPADVAALPEVVLVDDVATEDSNHPAANDPAISPSVPTWAADAIFYQIFPERFRNGDPANDPTRASLEFPDIMPESWAVTPWTSDWYARAAWERELGDNFYEDGVFHRRYGGDLQGVLDKLAYLDDLGINAIYFNPVFYARSLHKYDGNSFHHVDPYFGPDPAGDFELIATETADPQTWKWTAADKLFLKLIREAHARGIRIVIDGVFNHTGRDFFAFADIRRNQQQSPYEAWYIITQFDDPATPQSEFRYKGWWGIDTLPEFANNADGTDLHPGPRDYIFACTQRWMDPNADGNPQDGIDGWRLDVANEVPAPFWHDWNAYVRRLNPEAYTVAEIWDDPQEFLDRGGFSATMNYHGFAFGVKGYLIDGQLKPTDFGRLMDTRLKAFPRSLRYAVQNLIDSHDTDRLASMIVNANQGTYLNTERFDYDIGERASPRHSRTYDVRRPNAEERDIQRLVALFQATYVGPPLIYYGTEAGMWGGDDPCDRKPMVWDDLEYEPEQAHPHGLARTPDVVRFERELFAFYRRLFALRNREVALRRGDFERVHSDDDAMLFAFRRTVGEESLLVVVNRGDQPYAGSLGETAQALADADRERIFTTWTPSPENQATSRRPFVLP